MRRHRRPILIIMTLMMAWMSLWTPACLAMGAGQASTAGMSCDCPFAGQLGGMAAGCAKADNLTLYVDAKPVPLDIHIFHALPPAPMALLPAVSHVAAALPAMDRPPPLTSRRLNVRYCVFLI